jgi:hypothetical protein
MIVIKSGAVFQILKKELPKLFTEEMQKELDFDEFDLHFKFGGDTYTVDDMEMTLVIPSKVK